MYPTSMVILPGSSREKVEFRMIEYGVFRSGEMPRNVPVMAAIGGGVYGKPPAAAGGSAGNVPVNRGEVDKAIGIGEIGRIGQAQGAKLIELRDQVVSELIVRNGAADPESSALPENLPDHASRGRWERTPGRSAERNPCCWDSTSSACRSRVRSARS